MRKSGGFSLACYIIYLLGGLGLVLYSYIVAPTLEGWEGLGILVLIILGIYSAGIGLVGLILKLLHMGTGAGFFGFLCVLVDLFVIGVVVYACFDGSVSLNDPTTLVLTAIPGGMFLGSFISNIKSMKA
jgi:hypothetical protein